MKLRVFAPTRMDLAGGTLDIYPLYVFEGGGLTLNAAIGLCSEVELEVRADQRIRVEAVDLDLVLDVPSLEKLHSAGEYQALDLIIRILRFYKPACGLTVRTRNHIPSGSGLGGSSSLLVSLSTALIQLENLPVNKMQMIDFGANIEAQSIGIPTGKQDYFPPAFGGFNALWLGLEGIRREPFTFSPEFMNQLQAQVLLGYSGASRFSGTNNWAMLRRYVESEGSTVENLRTIKETALAMYDSLKREDLESLGRCLDQEWKNRKVLAQGVSTPSIERMFEAAEQAGALASKICGAGGGGCFITLVREGCQEAVRRAIHDAGGEVLDYRFSLSGVKVIE